MPLSDSNLIRLLLIEDHEGDYHLVKALLSEVRDQEYTIDWVWNWEDGKQRLCDGDEYDACLLDYRLDPHDGLELLQVAAECHCPYPIIVLTGFQQYEIDLAAMRAGAADYLSKDELAPGLLERTIRYAIQQRRAEEQRLSLLAEREARERAEMLARTMEQNIAHFRQLAESLPQLIWTTDAHGVCDYLSRQWCEYVGRSEAEQLGPTGWLEAIHPEDRDRTSELWLAATRGEKDYDLEYRLRRHDGEYRWFKTRGVALRSPEGQIERWFGSCTDMHDAKLAEAWLKEMNEVLEQRVAERTAVAEQRAAQLRALASELTQTEQRERRRLAQTLHDHLQQLLVAAKLHLGRVKLRTPSADVQAVIDLLDQAIGSSRSLTVELSPPILYDAGLAAGLEWLARWMQEKHGLRVDVRADPAAQPAADDLTVCLFNSVRELLFNIVKHAGVDHARVRMERDDGLLTISIEDDGRGFDPGGDGHLSRLSGNGFGLFSIEERLEIFSGEMRIHSRPGAGTRVILRAPLSEPATQPADI